ncbi:MAG TPA: DNA methyltransferase [Armatimonadota bacterium]|jgi:DNA modification methylase
MITASPLLQVQTIGPAGTPTPLFPDGRHRLLHGDCLEVARALPTDSFDAIYLDPPFFSGEDRFLHNGNPGSELTYTDSWGNLHAYLNWLHLRVTEMHRLLKPEGVFFMHLDWHAIHYVKVMLDGLFGYDNFQNEFIWYYSGGGASRQRFARKHDNILFYTKSATHWKFYADRVRTAYRWVDGQKRADGSARDYERGKLPDDVWEHHSLMPWADENLGYPTQKPEPLLERLLLATTDPGDVVGDFFSGSGTTAAVAQRLGRHWVAADSSRVAICLTAERLAEQLFPGCIAKTAQRSRARARERFARILADEARLGVDEATLETFRQDIDCQGDGVSVERLI